MKNRALPPLCRRAPAWLLVVSLSAQAAPDVPAREAEVRRQVVQALVAFARTAEGCKAHARARAAYAQILADYDDQNPAARAGLGWRRVRGEWQLAAPGTTPPDAATPVQRRTVDDAWRATQKRVARLHRELGTALLTDGHDERGRFHLERSLAFDYGDEPTHRALGHERIDDFWGTPEQLAFVRRMRAIADKARELASQDFEAQPLPATAMPKELAATGLPFQGARSRSFVHWVIGAPGAATASVVWAERGAALLEWIAPPGAPLRLQGRRVQWLAVLRTRDECETLFAATPKILGEYTRAQARLLGGLMFDAGGGRAEYSRHAAETDADHAVGHVTKRCFACAGNDGLGEGLVHAMTWLLVGTTRTAYAALPHTVGGGEAVRTRDPDEWRAALYREIETGTDFPLVEVPRERHDRFRDACRAKSWSFVLWLLARHPDEWVHLLDALKAERPTTEEVEAAFREVLQREVADVDAEWRAWARADSRIAKASGLGR